MTSAVSESPPRPAGPFGVLAVAACLLPALLAYNVAPSATFFNQVLALLGWGGVAAAIGWQGAPGAVRHCALPWAGLALLALAAVVSMEVRALPTSLGLSAIGMLMAAGALVWAGAAVPAARRDAIVSAVCWGWVAAGMASAAIALVQVFAPSWADGSWIARSGFPGRAVGNLRQPNHLASLLLWSCLALLPLAETRRLSWRAAFGLMAVFVFAIELTASRTGTLGTLVVALWGLADRRLSRPGRALLLSAPVWYGVAVGALALVAAAGDANVGAASRPDAADLSSSRFGIWSNTLSLIAAHPWSGVGWGNFNFAWSLTPFPGRPVAFFDHTHNLPLQWAVELGLPLAAVVLLLFGGALLQALRAAWAARPDPRVPGSDSGPRALIVMTLMVLVHSMLEYPLWYAYFLLPTAFALGVCRAATEDEAPSAGAPGRTRALFVAGMLVVLGAMLSFVDYLRVVDVFVSRPGAAPLAQRIADGQRSLAFAHHADYAAATVADEPSTQLPALLRASHFLLDTRLMTTWAEAYDGLGDGERARHLAARLREFRNPKSTAWFAVCDDPTRAAQAFQCESPRLEMDWRDFLHASRLGVPSTSGGARKIAP